MRVLVFHGYLLRGTGSNVYNARLCAALARAGHSVDLLCQEPRPEELDFVDAVGTWEGGEARVRTLREPVRVTAWRPDIGAPAAGLRRRPLRGLRGAHAAGVQRRRGRAPTWRPTSPPCATSVARARPDVALANHLVMGPAILARGLGGDVPYAVKVHGSALEYVVKRDPERFLPCAREGLARARDRARRLAPHGRVAVGGDARTPALPERTRLGPPGVDVDEFRPRDDAAAGGRRRLIERLDGRAATDGGEGSLRARRRRGRRAPCAGWTSTRDRHVVLRRQAHRLQGRSTCCWRPGRSCWPCPTRGSSSSASAPSATAC